MAISPLHDINPARLDYIRQRTELNAGPTVDIGCGGGILSESMASAGSATLGIDMASKAQVAKLHVSEAEGVDIEYLESTAEQLVQDRAGEFRTVTCMEMLEHVTAYADTESLRRACTTRRRFVLFHHQSQPKVLCHVNPGRVRFEYFAARYP